MWCICNLAFAKCLLEGKDPSEYEFVNPRKQLAQYLPQGIILYAFNNKEHDFKRIGYVFVLYFLENKKIITNDILVVRSWGRSEVWSAPSSDLVRRWGKTCGQKMGQPGLKTGAPTSNQHLVGRWGRPVLKPGRSEDGAQQIHVSTGLLSQ